MFDFWILQISGMTQNPENIPKSGQQDLGAKPSANTFRKKKCAMVYALARHHARHSSLSSSLLNRFRGITLCQPTWLHNEEMKTDIMEKNIYIDKYMNEHLILSNPEPGL